MNQDCIFFWVNKCWSSGKKRSSKAVHSTVPSAQYMVYLPTITIEIQPNIGKYTIYIECLGMLHNRSFKCPTTWAAGNCLENCPYNCIPENCTTKLPARATQLQPGAALLSFDAKNTARLHDVVEVSKIPNFESKEISSRQQFCSIASF